ncbi:hypothetical protein T439DRAFT_324224 [Meredithblackwellia eburnea MCA 4105]
MLARLPFELRTIIASHFPPAQVLPQSATAARIRPYSSFSATLDRSNRPIHLDEAHNFAESGANPDNLSESPSFNLFESSTTEYQFVPLSTLDHIPSTVKSKSPAVALAKLLRAKQYDDADALVRNLLMTGDYVKRLPRLLDHMRKLFREDKSSWIEWWTLVNRIPADPVEHWLSGTTVGVARDDAWIYEELIRKGDTRMMVDFSLAAIPLGFEREIAEHFLVHLALYADPEVSERVWRECMRSLLSRKATVNGALAKRPRKESAVVGRLLERRLAEAATFIGSRREGMIRAHASVGRLDYAVSLVMKIGIDEGGPRLHPDAYLSLLALAAAANKRETFLFLHLHFQQTGRTLLPPKAQPAKNWTALWTKPSDANRQPADLEAATKAFDLYRKNLRILHSARYIDPEEPLGRSLSGVSSPHSSGDNSPTMSANDRLLEAVKAKDIDVASLVLTQSLRENAIPALSSTSQYITLLREAGRSSTVDGVSNAFGIGGSSTRWLMGYWASARMLADIRAGSFDRALSTLIDNFHLTGLPPKVRDMILHAVPARPSGAGKRPLPRLLLPAHTLSIAVQALVRKLVLSGSHSLIDELYHAFTSPSSTFNITQRSHLQTKKPNLDRSGPQYHSPLDPFTFIPFLLAFAQFQRSPITLFRVLRDMHHLGLTPTRPHWGVVVGAFARNGSPAEIKYLLDFLEGRSPTTTPSPELISLLHQLEVPEEKPDVVFYTGVIKGLILQGEYDLAWEVWDRLESDDKGRALEEQEGARPDVDLHDRMLKKVMKLLGHWGGPRKA